ncbi:MAG: hypothetical protein K0R76_247 [Alphaproteobacteria bacterium]|nr:hypothetical protein [Alphaproteobacteria bacterium]
MKVITIFKKLKTLYWRVLDRNRQIALQVVERPANDTSLFEGHSLPRQPFLKVTRVIDRAKQKCGRFREGSVGKLDPELEHPPPAHV